MTRWEYKILSVEGATPIDLLNELGDVGWELVATESNADSRILIFKREIPFIQYT